MIRAGEKFARLTTVEPAMKRGKRAWTCVCECGSTCIVTTSHLGRGVKSCGCLRRRVAAETGRRTAKRKTYCPYGHPYDEENTAHRKDNNRQVCRSCRNREMRKYTLKYLGWTVEGYDSALIEQKELCAICHRPEPHKNKRLAADHDHITKKSRQLLCSSCNSGIGLFYDNPEFLVAAAEYLRKHGK